MRSDVLQDSIYRGLGAAARVLGGWAYAYRPSAPAKPLDPSNRYLRLQASFAPQDYGFGKPGSYGRPLWYGIFDAAYVQVGDYVCQDQDVWFVAGRQRLVPVLCVKANRTVDFARAAAPGRPGLNDYGGVQVSTMTKLLQEWPVSVLNAGAYGLDEAHLPADVRPATWEVLLPACPGVALRTGDLMTDDLGRAAIISSAEMSELGWRLAVRQVTT